MIKEEFRVSLRKAQDKISKEHDKNGLTDEVLDAQLQVNKIRNILDIHDEADEVYGRFVQ